MTVECFGWRAEYECPSWVLRWSVDDGSPFRARFAAYDVLGDFTDDQEIVLLMHSAVPDKNAFTLLDPVLYEDQHATVLCDINHDGCMNIQRQPDHYCRPQELSDVTGLLARCWQLAVEAYKDHAA